MLLVIASLRTLKPLASNDLAETQELRPAGHPLPAHRRIVFSVFAAYGPLGGLVVYFIVPLHAARLNLRSEAPRRGGDGAAGGHAKDV